MNFQDEIGKYDSLFPFLMCYVYSSVFIERLWLKFNFMTDIAIILKVWTRFYKYCRKLVQNYDYFKINLINFNVL